MDQSLYTRGFIALDEDHGDKAAGDIYTQINPLFTSADDYLFLEK